MPSCIENSNEDKKRSHKSEGELLDSMYAISRCITRIRNALRLFVLGEPSDGLDQKFFRKLDLDQVSLKLGYPHGLLILGGGDGQYGMVHMPCADAFCP